MSKARQLHRVQHASNYVMSQIEQGVEASLVLARMASELDATFRRGKPNYLQCAGIRANITGTDDQLLEAWRKNATIKIVMLRQEL